MKLALQRLPHLYWTRSPLVSTSHTNSRLLSMVATRRSSRVAAEGSEAESRRPVKRARISTADNVNIDTASTSQPSSSRQNHRRGGTVTKLEDYPERVSSLWKVGAHVSSAGGVENAVQNAAAIGANAFALFLKSQRKWESPPFKESSVETFKTRMSDFGYSASHVLPHGSYLINLGNPDEEKREKAYGCFLDDLHRCEQLGLSLYNFHPGSTVGSTTSEASITFIAEYLNRAHQATKFVITVIENMAGAGNIIGATFDDLAGIINQVKNKARIGVCLDTCHLFAAGYDIRTKEGWENTISDFDAKVGLSYLRGMHLNDSKTELNSKRDRHENIGLGHIGLSAFQNILADPRVQNIPLILETPSFEKPEVWAKEVDVLNRLSTLGTDDGDQMREDLVEEIRDVVKGASASAKPKRGSKTGSRKGSKKEVEDDQEDYG